MFKLARRMLIRPFWRSAALAFLWSNRTDATRWAKGAMRAVKQRPFPSKDDLVLEGRVRAAISADATLRGDGVLRDVVVRDGVVVLVAPDEWRHRALAISRLSGVQGVLAVQTVANAADADVAATAKAEMADGRPFSVTA